MYKLLAFLALTLIFSCEKKQEDSCMFCKQVVRNKATGQITGYWHYGEKVCDEYLEMYKNSTPQEDETSIVQWECERLHCQTCDHILTDITTGLVTKSNIGEVCNENLDNTLKAAPVRIQNSILTYECH